MRPTRRHRTSSPRAPPYSALHRVGFAWPPCHHDAGALLPHHFTVAAGAASRTRCAVSFLWHFPEGFPCWTLSSTLLCGVRTFLEERPGPKVRPSPRLPGLHVEYSSGPDEPVTRGKDRERTASGDPSTSCSNLHRVGNPRHYRQIHRARAPGRRGPEGRSRPPRECLRGSPSAEPIGCRQSLRESSAGGTRTRSAGSRG